MPVEIGPEWQNEYDIDDWRRGCFSSYVGYEGVIAHFYNGRAVVYSLDKMREGKHPWINVPVSQLKFKQ